MPRSRRRSLGADDFINRPISNDDLVIRVAHAMEHRRLLDELETLRSKLSEGQFIRRLMAPSAAMSAMVDSIRRVAKSNLTVLITGETGTGKELVARAVHQESERRDKPFVAVDCGALPENIIESELFGYHKGAFTGADRQKPGYFEAAEGGTLFLDEVGNLPPATQIKLLRVIQERELRPLGSVQASPLNVRLIAATNEKLEARIPAAALPRRPLLSAGGIFDRRCRRCASGARTSRCSRDVSWRRRAGTAPPHLQRLTRRHRGAEAHSWPGNIRELRNVMRNAVVQCRGVVIESDHVRLAMGIAGTTRGGGGIRLTIAPPMPLRKIREEALAAIERKAIARCDSYTNGNKAAAARLLEVDVKTLYTKLRLYDLGSPDN